MHNKFEIDLLNHNNDLTSRVFTHGSINDQFLTTRIDDIKDRSCKHLIMN